jgi:hypothetical protein
MQVEPEVLKDYILHTFPMLETHENYQLTEEKGISTFHNKRPAPLLLHPRFMTLGVLRLPTSCPPNPGVDL